MLHFPGHQWPTKIQHHASGLIILHHTRPLFSTLLFTPGTNSLSSPFSY